MRVSKSFFLPVFSGNVSCACQLVEPRPRLRGRRESLHCHVMFDGRHKLGSFVRKLLPLSLDSNSRFAVGTLVAARPQPPRQLLTASVSLSSSLAAHSLACSLARSLTSRLYFRLMKYSSIVDLLAKGRRGEAILVLFPFLA